MPGSIFCEMRRGLMGKAGSRYDKVGRYFGYDMLKCISSSH